MTFAETFNHNNDDLSSRAAGLDPNERAFTWVAMDDYTVQKAKAVCVRGLKDNNNYEDILLGGVEGMVVCMPSHYGLDHYVRAVRFKLTNLALPGHLRKRHPSVDRVYEFHYDYNFHNLRRDGGKAYFHVDFSTHVGY
ncbi:hypothetical protein BJX68DRAFT_269995 [Aspergillus pseudodeflectus]|uniref:Uncharacterized protein n=1 Tax=Aspergillus pseudodeflectus TaxID=176178 RepID=A0ABR4JW59_9EURO